MYFDFTLQLSSKILLILRRIEQDIVNVHIPSCKVLFVSEVDRILSTDYEKTLTFFISVFNQLDAQNLFHNKFYFMPLHVSRY